MWLFYLVPTENASLYIHMYFVVNTKLFLSKMYRQASVIFTHLLTKRPADTLMYSMFLFYHSQLHRHLQLHHLFLHYHHSFKDLMCCRDTWPNTLHLQCIPWRGHILHQGNLERRCWCKVICTATRTLHTYKAITRMRLGKSGASIQLYGTWKVCTHQSSVVTSYFTTPILA